MIGAAGKKGLPEGAEKVLGCHCRVRYTVVLGIRGTRFDGEIGLSR